MPLVNFSPITRQRGLPIEFSNINIWCIYIFDNALSTKSTVLWSYFLSNIYSCKHLSNCSEFFYYANFIYFSSLLWNSWQSSFRTSDVAFSKNVEKQLPIQCPSPGTIFILKKASLFATKVSCSLSYKRLNFRKQGELRFL